MADFRKHTGMWGYVINRSFWRFATFMLRKKKNTHTDLVMRILRAAWINRKRSLLPMENIASHINKFWKFLVRKHPFKNIQESYMVIKQAPRRSLLPLPILRECFQSTIFISYMSLVFIIRKKKIQWSVCLKNIFGFTRNNMLKISHYSIFSFLRYEHMICEKSVYKQSQTIDNVKN